jgi:lipopolysaccharide export system permease protein
VAAPHKKDGIMTLVSRYVLGAFFRLFGLSLAAFVGLYLLVEFFERVDDFIEHQAALHLYLVYFASKLPLIISQVAPLACLMAVFMTLGGLTRTSELTAMHAGGISLTRIAAPLVGIALLLSLLLLAANEYVVPASVKKARHTLLSEVCGGPSVIFKRDKIWLRQKNKILNIRLAEPESQTLRGITIMGFDDAFRVLTRIDAATAVFRDGAWLLREATERTFEAKTGTLLSERHQAEKTVQLAITPEDFKVPGSKRNEDLAISELRHLAQKLKAEGYDPTRFQVDLQARIAAPFACAIMAFLGVPFAIRKGRGTSLAMGIAISIAIGAIYFILHAALLAFGYSGVFPPLVAAWAANLLFALFGGWLFLLAET